MASKSNMTLRIEPELKEQAAALFKSLGLDLSTATGIFYRQALRYHGLPFEIRADEEPNEVTYAAMEANAQVMNELKNAEASKAYKVKTETEEAQRIAEALKDKTVRITAKAGQGGRLFGSVTAKEIAQEIKKQYGFDIDKRKIHLDTDIKAFGGYHIEVKLYNGITAKLAVSVTEAQ